MFCVGDKVVFVDKIEHEREPRYYPKCGTVGEVLAVGHGDILVQWPDGSTSGADMWLCRTSSVKLYLYNDFGAWFDALDVSFLI